MSLRCAVFFAVMIAALNLAVPSLSLAQRGTGEGFQFYSSSVVVGFDSGISAESTSPFGDQLIQIVPTAVAYENSFGRSTLQFIYEPEFEIYTSLSELNAWNNAAAFAYQAQLTRNLSLGVNASFIRTNDASRQTANLTLAPRGRYMEGRGDVNLGYEINNRTRAMVFVSGGYTNITRPDINLNLFAIENVLSTLNTTVTRSLSSSQSLSVGYSRQRSNLLGQQASVSQVTVSDGVDASYDYTTRSGLRFSGGAGLLRRPQVGDDVYSYSLRGSVSKAWDPVSVSVGYNRNVVGLLSFTDPDPANQLVDPLRNSSLAETIGANVRGQIAGRVSLTQSLQWSRIDAVLGGEPRENIYSGSTASFRVGNKVAPYVRFTYWWRTVGPVTDNVQRGRLVAGLRFFWKSLAGTRQPAASEPLRGLLGGRR